jgi:hypothetical protein
MSKPTTVTSAQREALVDALPYGTIWKADRRLSNWGFRYHGLVTLKRLEEAGLIHYARQSEDPLSGANGWQLTDAGRSVALGLPDKESSASRQHFIDTGRYLSYRHREELSPAPFKVGDTVRSKNRGFELEMDVKGYLIVGMQFVSDLPGWLYSVEVIGGGEQNGTHLDQVHISPNVYELVQPEAEPCDWELMAPLVAAAAVLVATGRGDEVVGDYRDGTPTALELLTELVESAR